MLQVIRWCSILGILLGVAGPGVAQSPSSFPDRPVRLVIAFPPGGAAGARHGLRAVG